MFWKALGSFDVNTVFPLPGSWINHVTRFAEIRLWECRVFTVFPYRQVRRDCIFTGFADNLLLEYRIFSFKKACLAQTSRVFLWIFHLFLFLEALQSFVRLWKALGSFGRLWRVLLALRSFVRLWEALSGGFERLRKVLGGFVT